MIYPDYELHAWGSSGGIQPFNPSNVNPASVDLTLDGRIKVPLWYWRNPVTRFLAWKLRNQIKIGYWSESINFTRFTLWPGQFVLCASAEVTRIPDDAMALLFSKSSTGRTGLEHLHAGLGDPSFNGAWTWELINVAPWPIELVAGKRLMQVVLICAMSSPDHLYSEVGHYQNQVGPTEAR